MKYFVVQLCNISSPLVADKLVAHSVKTRYLDIIIILSLHLLQGCWRAPARARGAGTGRRASWRSSGASPSPASTWWSPSARTCRRCSRQSGRDVYDGHCNSRRAECERCEAWLMQISKLVPNNIVIRWGCDNVISILYYPFLLSTISCGKINSLYVCIQPAWCEARCSIQSREITRGCDHD